MDKIIYLDMDGVVVNILDSITQVLGPHKKTPNPINSVRYDVYGQLVDVVPHMSYYINEYYDMNPEEFWDQFDEDFWINLPMYENSEYLIKGIVDRGFDFYFCTSPTPNPTSLSGKKKWIEKHFGKNFQRYIMTPYKKFLNPNFLLIDDYDANVNSYRKNGGKAILFPRPYNSNKGITDFPEEFVLNNIDKLYKK